MMPFFCTPFMLIVLLFIISLDVTVCFPSFLRKHPVTESKSADTSRAVSTATMTETTSSTATSGTVIDSATLDSQTTSSAALAEPEQLEAHHAHNHTHIGDASVRERKHSVCGQNFKCVISFALYGADPKYLVGAVRNAILAKEVFEGWIPRYYYDAKSVPASVLDDLKMLGGELVPFENKKFLGGMFARFSISEDNTVDRYIIRDADSRLGLREKAAVDAWIKSGYAIHTIRDHVSHCRPMNGGLWGGTKGAIKGMSAMASKYKQNKYNDDQAFLTTVIWPLVKDNQIAHDSACCEQFPNSHPFPTRRIGWEHVGAVYDDKEAPRPTDAWWFLLYKPTGPPLNRVPWEAPLKCRLHPDWIHG